MTWTLRTRLIATGRPEGPGAPLNTPIMPASTFAAGGERGYARSDGTDTWQAMERVVGAVEGGHAVGYASGMAAITAALEDIPAGSRIAVVEDCYLGTSALLRSGEQVGRWHVTWLAASDVDAWVAAAASHDVLWLESPTNPLMHVMDLPRILGEARNAPCRTVVDNTFATPLLQQPLSFGADIVVHSATKFFSGHSDLLAGVAVAANPALAASLRQTRLLTGATPGMLEAFLVTRGLRTLALRLDAASATAHTLAERLTEHPAVARVRYPGLPEDPGHHLACRFMTGFGAMLSFELAGAEAADDVCRRVRLIRHATSLGGVESTIERRAAQPGQGHVPQGLLRLSTGCEDVEDLWRDLRQALA